MKKLITITLLFLITFQMFGQNFKFVNAERLNIREHAGKKYNIIEQAIKGDKVTIISESGRWSQIETKNGVKGYVSTKYLSANNEPKQWGKYDWVNVLIELLFLGWLGYKIISFFSRLFSKNLFSSQRKYTTRDTGVNNRNPKEILLRWYHCKNCNETIRSPNKPNVYHCSNTKARLHFWTDLGVLGDHAYNCRECGTTVYTKATPTLYHCSNTTARLHRWTKLS